MRRIKVESAFVDLGVEELRVKLKYSEKMKEGREFQIHGDKPIELVEFIINLTTKVVLRREGSN